MSIPLPLPASQFANAMSLASAGLPVFPCDAGPKTHPRYSGEPSKAPLTRHGFKDATTDGVTIQDWWSRYPVAFPAVPMGAPSGLFAIDADIDGTTGEAIGERTLRGLGCDPSAYPFTARTVSGGAHLLFRWSSDLPRNSTKASNGLAGVDIRGDGGYVIAWQPEVLIAAKRASDLPSPPTSLLKALANGSAAHTTASPSLSDLAKLGATSNAYVRPGEDCAAWAEKALAEEIASLRMTPKGGRNHAVNRGAFSLGQIVGAGHLTRERVEAEIWAAGLANGLAAEEEKATRRTIKSGLDAGIAQPRGPAGASASATSGGSGGATAGTKGDQWPDLVPIEGGDLPSLSADLLGGWLGDYAAALAASTETPLELAASMVLGAASTAAARRVRVRVKPDYFEPCNLWLLPSLAPGNRKSAVEKAAARPLRDWERETGEALAGQIADAVAQNDVAKARAKELKARAAKANDDIEARELASEAADVERCAPVIPKPPQLWTSDATPENLGVLLADQGERMAWLSAEAGFFEIVGGRYSKGVPNLDLMLKAHAGDAERVDRIGRPSVYLREPLLTVAMSPQPELLRGLVAQPGFRGRGLLGRFLYFLPRSPLGWRTLETQSVPEPTRLAYERGLLSMLDWPEAFDEQEQSRAHILKLTTDAYEEWHAFAMHIERLMRPGAEFEFATDWAGKAPGAAIRVAGVLHAADHAHGRPWIVDIPRETMQRALDIVGTSSAHTLAAYRLMAADPGMAAAQQLWEWIQRKRRSTFKARDAWQGLKGTNAFSRMADITAALERLAERGYLVLVGEVTGKPGRATSPIVVVRPELAEGW